MGAAQRGTYMRWAVAVFSCTVLAVLVTQAGMASAASQLERLSSFGPDGTAATDFARVAAIAPDEEEQIIYALDFGGSLYKFDLSGQPISFGGVDPDIDGSRIDGLDPYTPEAPGNGGAIGLAQVAVAPSTHNIYVTEKHAIRAFEADGEPHEFTAGPGAGTSEIPGFDELFGVGVDSNGNIYGSDYAGVVKIYAPTGALITSFGATQPHHLAIADDGAVYVSEANKIIKRFSPDIYPPSASTVYSGTTAVAPQTSSFIVGFGLDHGANDIYAIETFQGENWIQRYSNSGEALESFGRPGTSTEGDSLGGASEGITVLVNPYVVQEGEEIKLFVGDSVDSESKIVTLGSRNLPGPPIASRLRATDVTADSAVLRGAINPKLRPTTYRFEYGLSDCSLDGCTSIPVEGAAIGEGSEEVTVAQSVTQLAPNATYHFRLVAENVLGESEESGTFTTQSIGSVFQLSDSRAWEMVSPSNKGGGTLTSPSLGHIQAAAGGGRVTYLSQGSIEVEPAGNRSFEVSSILSTRSSGGWKSKDISPANLRRIPFAAGNQGEFKLFSQELSDALLVPHDGLQLSVEASERTPYLWHDSSPPIYEPLVTGKEGFANVPPGTEFGGSPRSALGPVGVSGANKNLSGVVLNSNVPLVAGGPSKPALYYWQAGQLGPVSMLPDTEGGEVVTAELGSGGGSVRHAISEDGSRVFWSQGNYSSSGGVSELTGLYLRDIEAEESIRLDVVQLGGTGLGQTKPVFQGANADGTVVFFKDSQQLTEGASTTGRDLYRCEISSEEPSGGCATLTNITAEATAGSDSAEVIGVVSGMSDDARTLFFVARGVLDTAPNQFGAFAEAGQPNIYRWEEGEVRFVTKISEADAPSWGGSFEGRTSRLSASISPDGRYFAFMSQKDLSGQGNLDAETGNPVQEVFLYEAEAEDLVCVSCDPTGAAPTGQVSAGFSQMVDPVGQWGGKWVAAILPQPRTIAEEYSIYQPRAVLNNGRVFFNTLAGLVPADSNGEWDVYQFEPLGLGSCNPSSGGAATVRSGDGCISLISSGTGDEESVFFDASSSGDDVFFLSPAQLSVLDDDHELDVYDARVNGTPAVLTPAAECVGEACRPEAVGTPSDVDPGSASFAGHGNVKGARNCPKGKRKVRRGGKTQCVAKKKQRRHAQPKEQGSRAGERSR